MTTVINLRERQAVYRRRSKVRVYLRRGAPAYIDAGPAWAHVEALRAEGWSEFQIAQCSGVLAETINQRLRTISPDKAAAILAVTGRRMFDTAPDLSWVPAIGARRRIQALHAIGWQMGDIAGRGTTVRILAGCTLTSARSWRTVRDSYERLSMERGPSDRARRRSAEAGWPPPLAWDDDSIDDPAARAQL